MHILQDEDEADGNLPDVKSKLKRFPKVNDLFKLYRPESDDKKMILRADLGVYKGYGDFSYH